MLVTIDAEMERGTDDAMYETLEQARSAVWADVTERAENNVRHAGFVPAVPLKILSQ